MKIQTKLTLAFLALSLPFLVVTNITFYSSEKKALSHNILNHLESVASIQQHRIHDINEQNAERLRLVTSRTQLRLSLKQFLISTDERHQLKMNGILRNAKEALPDFKHIYVYSPDGVLVASSDPSRKKGTFLHEDIFISASKSNKVDQFYLDAEQNLSLHLAGPLYLENKFLGVLIIDAKADNMVTAISDYTGLGQTGETILAAKNQTGDTVFIMPTRFDRQAALRLIISKNDNQIPINRAFSGKGLLLTDAIDYRQVPILAATRYLEDVDWGIVVKIDREEAFSPLARMNTLLISILAGAVSLIIFLSFILAKSITKPIVKLTGVAHNIADDNFKEQAEESYKDEIGSLATAFNSMTKKLIGTRKILEKNIDNLQDANQQLIAGEERYREIFNTPRDAIFMHDANTGKILDVNQGMLDMYGYTHEEALQLDVGSISSGEQPYTMENAVLKVQNAMLHGPQKFDWKCRKKDDTLFWTEMTLKYTEFSGHRYVIAVVRDIDERINAEKSLAKEKEQLAVTLRSIGDGVITTDTSGNVVLINKVAENLTGWKKDEAIGRPLAEVFHIINERTREICENPFTKVLSSGQIIGLTNHSVLVAKDGTEISIADSGAPILDAQSVIIGVVLVFRDVREQIKTERELLKVKKLESIGVLAGGIAHDFNNILVAILGNINLALYDEDLKGTTRNLLSEAEKASLRAKGLTQQLLTFSKGGDPVKETSSLENVIKESANFVLHGDKVACQYMIPKDLWLVDIDKGQISQVIQNIVINASHAMPEGGAIKISCENTTSVGNNTLDPLKDGKFVKICIQDSGIGIPQKVIERIFDPYFSTKREGSGLGLAITQSIIIKHNGKVLVESSPGVGSTFSIYLPASDKTKPHTQTVISKCKSSSETKILIMDDDEMVRNVAEAMLDQLGHNVTLAIDGREAIKLYKESMQSGTLFDLIVMDLTIPGGMGGKEAAQGILKYNPEAKIIVSSGYSNDPIMANFNDYGFSAAIVKPFQLHELSLTIKQILG